MSESPGTPTKCTEIGASDESIDFSSPASQAAHGLNLSLDTNTAYLNQVIVFQAAIIGTTEHSYKAASLLHCFKSSHCKYGCQLRLTCWNAILRWPHLSFM